MSQKISVVNELTKMHMNAQKKLEHTPQIPDQDLYSYKGLLKGNDPFPAGISQKCIQGNFVFVGTSLFGAVYFACELAKTSKVTPLQLIIVDNSKQVITCWKMLKEFFATTTLGKRDILEGSDDEKGIMDFVLEDLFPHIRDGAAGDNLYAYFMYFFKNYDFDTVKTLISNAIILKQSWASQGTFEDIKSAFPNTPIVAYPSNILSFVDDSDTRLGVLRCLHILQPTVCIFSNLVTLEIGDKSVKKPDKTYMLSEKFEIADIARTLQLEDLVPHCDFSAESSKIEDRKIADIETDNKGAIDFQHD